MDRAYQQQEKLNALSHAIGIILGIIGFYLMWRGKPNSSEYETFSIVVYSSSVILLFTASTLYHSIHKKKLKSGLRILDHISIYFLIAGTYTPVALITLINGNGWLLFAAVWSFAFIGSILKIFFTGRFEILSLLLYLIMGWLIVLDISDLIALSSRDGLFMMMLGGAFYTVGIIFYVWRKMPYNHFIWHLFVLGGAISHWIYINYEVLKASA